MIYRGAGIIVPIIVVIVGGILTIWFKDARVGNADYIKWVALYSSIVLFFAGLGLSGNPAERGKAREKHDFFFIPVIVWSFIIAGISIYAFVSPWGKYTDTFSADKEKNVYFYNPTGDTLLYLASDKSSTPGTYSQGPVRPYASLKLTVSTKSLLLASLTAAGEPYLTLPGPGFDTGKYKLVKDKKDKYYQRILPDPDQTAYVGSWFVMDKGYDMAAVNITGLYTDGKLTPASLETIDWTQKIAKRYPGGDLMEVRLEPENTLSVSVTSPDNYISKEIGDSETAYLLIVYPKGEKLTNEFLQKELSYFFEQEQ